jgi:hypothetical protein
VNNIRAAGLAINDGTVAVLANGSSSGASRVATLSVASAATLDLNDNDLVVTSGSTSQISTLIAQARHGGAWDQPASPARRHDRTEPRHDARGIDWRRIPQRERRGVR